MERLRSAELVEILHPISEDLDRVEKIILDASGGEGSFVTETATYLARAGGKRLRPALTLLASHMGTGPTDDVDKSAAAVEMTHLATLYHDDVIDDGGMRHGVESVNRRWGDHVAILAGDFLLARSSHLVSEVGGRVPEILASAVARVVEGQLSELREAFSTSRTTGHYFETIAGKTSALMEASTWIGAMLGGCSEPQVEAMRRFGAAFGKVFQMADDLLDLVATEAQLGKPPGTDLRQGVYTLPVLLATEAKPALTDRLGGADVDVAGVRDEVVGSGGFAQALAAARAVLDEAVSHLQAVPDGAGRESLERLTHLVIDRVPVPEERHDG